jgi:two-component system sensor histidine kinase RegB
MYQANVLSPMSAGDKDRILLRTLTNLRWMAIAGQSAALIAAPAYFGLILPLGVCTMAVGLSVMANLVFMIASADNKRLSETEALLMLEFDLAQLALLLAVTGGLTNPFALLMLAPVTISAMALGLRSTVIVAASAAALVTATAVYNLPLQLADESLLTVPPLFLFGFWLSIIIGIVFFATYSRRVATETRAMSDALFAAQMALAREQKLTDIGGVVAAAAHELGTPLATIKLVSSEMIDELADRDDLRRQRDELRDEALELPQELEVIANSRAFRIMKSGPLLAMRQPLSTLLIISSMGLLTNIWSFTPMATSIYIGVGSVVLVISALQFWASND